MSFTTALLPPGRREIETRDVRSSLGLGACRLRRPPCRRFCAPRREWPFFLEGIAAANRENETIKGVVAGGGPGSGSTSARGMRPTAQIPVQLLGERARCR